MVNQDGLSKKEAQIVDQLKSLFSEQLCKNEINELQVIQFLKGNEWDITKTEEQLSETLEWRKNNNIDSLPVATKYNGLPLLVACRGFKYVQDNNVIIKPDVSTSVIKILNSVGGSCFHKFDKEGHPILIDRTGHHNTKEMANKLTTEEIINYQISVAEFLNRVIMPEGSEKAGKRINSQTAIFDCTNMSLWQFHMGALNHLKAVIDVVQRHYPEVLNRLFIVNVPTAFLVMFKVVRPWLSPKTLEKIHILGSDYQSVLLEYIDSSNLPEFLGGSCKCGHMNGCVPVEKNKFKQTEENEAVLTPYNSNIMKKAMSDPVLSRLIQQ